MRLVKSLVSALLLLTLVVPSAQAAAKRMALVIGNAAYRHMTVLRNPSRDAGAVEAALKRLGFETTLIANADARAMNDGLKRFAQNAAGAEAIFVFYSGHGAQLNGRTWLLPVDARLDTKEDVNDADLMSLDRILDTLRDKSAVRIVVLDACRDNPAADNLNRRLAEAQGFKNATLTKGLGRPITSRGDLVVYATQAGDVAVDGNGPNSPFTENLLKHLETTDLDVRQMFFRVQNDVGTKYKQLPEVSNSLIGAEFKLRVSALSGRPGNAAPNVVTPPPDPCLGAEAHWKSAEAIATLQAFEDHVTRFPNCAFATLAQTRIAAIAPPGALPKVTRFDGIWISNVTCEKTTSPDLPGWKYQLIAFVREGKFQAQRGPEGQPGSETFEGMIAANGDANIAQRGWSGDPRTDPFHRPRGTEFKNTYIAQFEDTSGTAIRSNRASCTIEFLKQDRARAKR